MTQEPTPHGAFVKTVFAELEHAADELRAVLPLALVARIDWSTLRREPGSFVDEALKSRLTDMLFAMRTHGGGDLRVYVLFEHQSHADRWMVLRALEYRVRLWGELRARHPNVKLLPAVIPVVRHHGERSWRSRARCTSSSIRSHAKSLSSRSSFRRRASSSTTSPR